jgi:hypothetical protein
MNEVLFGKGLSLRSVSQESSSYGSVDSFRGVLGARICDTSVRIDQRILDEYTLSRTLVISRLRSLIILVLNACRGASRAFKTSQTAVQ